MRDPISRLASLPSGDQPLIAIVAGSGLIARCAVAAKADFLLALAAGVFRNLGRGSLASFMPYANSNQQTLTLLREQVLPAAAEVPVIAGVCAPDPTTDLDAHLQQLRDLGIAGVTNWPAIGFIDGRFREAIEQAGWGMEVEIDLLKRARSLGLISCGFVLDEQQAHRYCPHSDVLILNMGLTHRVEDIPGRQDQVRQSITQLNKMLAAIPEAGERPLCLAFGGPVTTAEDLEELLRHCAVDGFAGGSVFERLPVQSIVETTIRRFKSVAFRSRADRHDTGIGEMIGRSEPFMALRQSIERVAPHDVNVYIHGETGTGKELVATQIHRLSRRARGPMVTLNCGAIPDTLIESELFGHERGAFTGADRRRLGKFELAHHGTLFLDEVADLSPRGQVALLRAIQSGEITRIGAEQRIDVDVRIIAATHQNLEELVRHGRFRQDLYYRLNQITIRVPPLRERAQDVPLLTSAIVGRLRVQLNREIAGLSETFLQRLGAYAWPGNIRELEHVICRSAILESGEILHGAEFSGTAPADRVDSAVPAATITGHPKPDRALTASQAVARAHGNKKKAAADLGISRKTLYAWLRQ